MSVKRAKFTPLYEDQLDSPAMKALSAVAFRVYVILRQEYKGDYTGNRIICPYDTIVEKGVSRNSIPRALNQLEALGFIKIERGGLEHRPSEYIFSDKWSLIATPAEAYQILDDLKNTKLDEMARKELAEKRISELN